MGVGFICDREFVYSSCTSSPYYIYIFDAYHIHNKKPTLISHTFPCRTTGRRAVWLQFNHFRATVREALEKLNDLVDESDPDTSLPNIVHAFQAAERARTEFPQHDWLHLTALMHDLGKVMAFYGEPQWAVVGDTFPVGCRWSANIVYREESFEGNADGANEAYK